MKIDVINISGKKVSSLELPQEIFEADINQQLIAQAIRVYRANQRQGTNRVKSRGDVVRTKAKVWRQKGTGRARHGARSAPIFVGGGAAHAPTGLETYSLKMSKKMKRKALFSALSTKAKDKQIMVIDGLDTIKPKTKQASQILTAISGYQRTKKLLLVMPKSLPNVIQATRNLAGVSLTSANRLNVYEILNHHQLVFLKDSIDSIIKTYLTPSPKKASPTTTKSSTPTTKPKSTPKKPTAKKTIKKQSAK